MFHNRKLNDQINRIHERAIRIACHNSTFDELLVQDSSLKVHDSNLQKLLIDQYFEIFKDKMKFAPEIRNKVFGIIECSYPLRYE